MNTIKRDVQHNFNLKDMKVGNWFMGCTECNVQMPINTITAKQCPNCLSQMKVHYVTEQDIK